MKRLYVVYKQDIRDVDKVVAKPEPVPVDEDGGTLNPRQRVPVRWTQDISQADVWTDYKQARRQHCSGSNEPRYKRPFVAELSQEVIEDNPEIFSEYPDAEPEIDYSGYSWIKVKRHKFDPGIPTEENYADLDRHHVEETTFLIKEVRKLAALLSLTEEYREPRAFLKQVGKVFRLEYKNKYGVGDYEEDAFWRFLEDYLRYERKCPDCGSRLWLGYSDGHVWDQCMDCPEPSRCQLDLAGRVEDFPCPTGPMPEVIEYRDLVPRPYQGEDHEYRCYRKK